MNQNNLKQIFQHYIDRFEYVNGSDHIEYYKWQVCHEFPVLMKKALASDKEIFAKALNEVKKCTYNIIDSYTQPFHGLVEFSGKDPEAVRQLLLDLYADDGGDVNIRMQKIADFFKRSNELLEEHSPGSFLHKQNSHSVSALLFLNDPDHHFMYKATQSKRFADCVEFYDDWGTGDNIKLDTYHRMCNELVEEIKNCKELLDTDASRFDGRLKLSGGPLHPDTEKHILAFDLIYCCSVYDLFDGISYTKRNMKEKQLYLAEKKKAEGLKQSFEKAQEEMNVLEEALQCFVEMIHVGDAVKYMRTKEGTVKSIDEKYIVLELKDKEVNLGLPICLANNIISSEIPGFSDMVAKYRDVLKRYNSIPSALDYAARALEPYEEYLE